MNIFKKDKKHTKRVSGSDVLELEVTGMTCDGCATHVIQALEKVECVMQANVPSWQDGKAVIDLTGDINTEQITKAVENAGYSAKIVNDGGQKEKITHKPTKNGNTDYDLVVIGTGGGGVAASIRAAENGNKVAIIESGKIGGTCVNIGCVPSKTLIRAAEAYHKANHHLFAGIKTSSNGID